MKKEDCEHCPRFCIYIATLAKPEEQFTPCCTVDGTFKPISEIEICSMKNNIILNDLEYIKNACKDLGGIPGKFPIRKEYLEQMDKPFEERIKDIINYLEKYKDYKEVRKGIKELKKWLKKK